MDTLIALGQFFDSYRALYPLVIGLAVLSLWLLRAKYKDISKKISTRVNALDDLIDRIVKILGEAHGDPSVHLALLNRINSEIDRLEDTFLSHVGGCVQHFKDIDTIATKVTDRSLYQSCPVNQCPATSDIINSLKQLRENFGEFNRIAEMSRENTGTTLTKLSEQLTEIRAEVAATTKGTLSVLSKALKRGSNGKQ